MLVVLLEFGEGGFFGGGGDVFLFGGLLLDVFWGEAVFLFVALLCESAGDSIEYGL